MNCCLAQKRKRAQVENFLHFEESAKYFPLEFHLMFGGLGMHTPHQHFPTNNSIDDVGQSLCNPNNPASIYATHPNEQNQSDEEQEVGIQNANDGNQAAQPLAIRQESLASENRVQN